MKVPVTKAMCYFELQFYKELSRAKDKYALHNKKQLTTLVWISDSRGNLGEFWNNNTFKFNAYFCNMNYKEFISEVVIHEIAHYVDFCQSGWPKKYRKHGKQWKKIVRELGTEPYIYSMFGTYRTDYDNVKRFKHVCVSCGRAYCLLKRAHHIAITEKRICHNCNGALQYKK